jgi:hypothetical protein
MTIGVQSPSAEAQSHDSEFQSGILFGVAAAALTAATQEFMTSARKQREGSRIGTRDTAVDHWPANSC